MSARAGDKSGLIPWGSSPSFGDGAALIAEPGGGADAATVRKLQELKALFLGDTNQQLAYNTIVSEVLRCRLAWHVAAGELADETTPVPDWWHTFVTDAIKSILINGNFIYRRCGTRAGVAVCVVADPTTIYTVWSPTQRRYVATCGQHRWSVGLVEPPDRAPGVGRCAGAVACINSAAVRAQQSTLQLRAIVGNWIVRDKKNSENTVYTTISDAIRQQNGSDRQWFRNVMSNDTMPTRAADIDTNFHTLVHRRAQTIEKLDSITNMARGRNAAVKHSVGGTAGGLAPEDPVQHSEHVVSDGRTYTEARQLASMADSKLMIDELKHTILFAFGVPPQALGRNINSERIAASNRLTEMAITTYTSLINRLRERIGEAVRTETSTPRGGYVTFSVCLAQYELEKLQPYMKTDICAKMIARCYRIPESFLDAKKIDDTIRAQNGTAETSAPHAAPASRAAPPAVGQKRKADKAALTVEEAVKNKRDRANIPAK